MFQENQYQQNMTNLEDLVFRFRWQIAMLLFGFIIAACGVFLTINKDEAKFEVVSGEDPLVNKDTIVVEVSGAVNNSGVFEVASSARVEDVLAKAGGLSSDANTNWTDKYLNRAAYVTDGQKIYIPSQSELLSDNNPVGGQSGSEVLSSESVSIVNINNASIQELEALKGIGPVYAQKIIDNRPYSSVEELLVKKAVSQKIYDENYNLLTVY